MLTVWSEWYRRGQGRQYGPGQHVIDHVGSYEVDPGTEVVFYSGSGVRSSIPRPTQYHRFVGEAYHYPYLGHGQVTAVVRASNVRQNQVAKLGWRKNWSNGGIDLWEPVGPTGDDVWDSAGHFPNDELDWVEVPPSAVLTIYEHGGGGGSSLEFREGHHQLDDWWRNRVSSVKLVLDGWEEIFADADMRAGSDVRQVGVYLLSGMARNESDAVLTVPFEMEDSIENEIQQSWNADARITTKVEAGASFVAQVTAGLETSIGFGTGEARTEHKGQAVKVGGSVELQPGQAVRTYAEFRKMKGTFPKTSHLRNKETLEVIVVHGTITPTWGGDYDVYAKNLDGSEVPTNKD